MARRALLIANNTYEDKRIHGLFHTFDPAYELRLLLNSAEFDGLDTALRLNQSKADTEFGIGEFFDSLSPNDTVVFFFSGHAVRDNGGHIFLASSDTDLDNLDNTAMSLSFLSAHMTGQYELFVVLDCELANDINLQLRRRRPETHVVVNADRTTLVHEVWNHLRSDTPKPDFFEKPSPQPQPQSPPPPPLSFSPPPLREHVDWIDDAPAERDLLQRRALAEVLATRLNRAAADPQQASFLIHVDGPWGSGKSTLLKLLDRELSATHLVVGFNAWRNARVEPPWWALLTTIRKSVINDRPWYLRPFTVTREILARARRSGASLFLTALITAALIGGIYLLLPPLTTTLIKSIGSVVGGLIAVLGILWAVGSFASRFLLWNSSRGAQLLERSHTDPMGEVSAHFGWLIEHSRRPVVVFIDDLDRCDGPRVVEILEAVQTLARDQPEPSRAASFVVAADGAWLRRAYEDHYATFAGAVDQPGQPLGYLFQEKLFQLSVPVPVVGARSRATYLSTLLGGPSSPVQAVEAEQSTVSRRIDDSRSEAEVLDLLGGSSPQVRQNLAPQAARKLAEPEIEAATEHSLERFAPRLQANPRGVKRFLNTYSILRTLRTLEGNVVGTDTLAAWALLRSRWPLLADHLEHNPQDITAVRDRSLRELPKELRATATAPELHEFLAADDIALSESDIRVCCGGS